MCLILHELRTTMTMYNMKFKSLVHKLSELQPLLECTCGASKELTRRKEGHCVHLFLGGLDGYLYTNVKKLIFNINPLPFLRLGATFHSNKYKNRDGVRPKYDHYGKIGHENSRFFEIVVCLTWENSNHKVEQEESANNLALHGSHMKKAHDEHMLSNESILGAQN
ncbi:hypothetical protein CR513_16159, partial [Mucuna pruriens]